MKYFIPKGTRCLVYFQFPSLTKIIAPTEKDVLIQVDAGVLDGEQIGWATGGISCWFFLTDVVKIQ